VNEIGNVSEQTRERVACAIARLQYRPNEHAAQLSRNRENPIETDEIHLRLGSDATADSVVREAPYSKQILLQMRRMRSLELEVSRLRRVVDELTKELHHSRRNSQ
jgi:DNA-binding LacI/PurR family transcriptional regulator